MGRRTKNNPVLIGEPGVGKTAIAEGLAQRIANNDIPDIYNNNLNKNRKNDTSTFRLKRSQEKKLKKNALTTNFNL